MGSSVPRPDPAAGCWPLTVSPLPTSSCEACWSLQRHSEKMQIFSLQQQEVCVKGGLR